jgi:ABC-type nitrate/sulfonate/bicarbonate transport system substrate-binding protein
LISRNAQKTQKLEETIKEMAKEIQKNREEKVNLFFIVKFAKDEEYHIKLL